MSCRYGPEREPVLTGITFEVRAGERVAIVGRTGVNFPVASLSRLTRSNPGSGKSTLLGSLFRLIDSDGSIRGASPQRSASKPSTFTHASRLL